MKREHRIRSGFTLVELLIGIAVIGVLVGMLSYALIPAYKRAQEFTIQQEMGLLSSALEEFKTKHGFYPPSFVRIASADDILPFLNRIAPNHQEDTLVSPGVRYVDLWWTNVGQYIEFDHGDDLVFWLSGLVNNQQFPLTAGATTAAALPAAYDNGTVERDTFFDFNKRQLETEDAGTGAGALPDYIAHYLQPQGKEASYLYIDSESYGFSATFDGYTNAPLGSGGQYENSDTYQLVTYGMDGLPGNLPTDSWVAAGPEGEDNICNFSEGRLDKLINGVIDSTVRN